MRSFFKWLLKYAPSLTRTEAMVLFFTFHAACCGAVVALASLNRHEAMFAPDLCCTAFHKLPVRCCSVSRQGISVPVVIFSCTRHTTLLRRLVTCPRSRLMTQLLYTYGYFSVDCAQASAPACCCGKAAKETSSTFGPAASGLLCRSKMKSFTKSCGRVWENTVC